ncbi:sugar ABC transporter substrate-binding protein [Petroclostridium sp. X23]|uniref:sugar ABC transporter substrate-binding protein n=1 Tax=Petroclostridium sp. X23 TaxID=3045146 RepID=UPI0024ACEFC7|nr:sugar ABC transporter substrate-binding protein [Petroclostridium sp. X23]WHH60503.1 sugar ABC transporter substrate-binding protein [Petroclostridium sp. X23]
MKKLISFVLICLLMVTMVTGCSESPKNGSDAANSNTAPVEPKSAGGAANADNNAAGAGGENAVNLSAVPKEAQFISNLSELFDVKVDIKKLGENVEKKIGHKPVILVSIYDTQNEWNTRTLQSAIQAAKDAGVEVISANSQSDINKQISDIQNGIGRKVDAIVIPGGLASSLQEVLKAAKDANIPVTTCDVPSEYVTSCVTADNYSGGVQLAAKMCADLKGKGNVAVLYSPGWHTVEVRRWMLDEVLKDFPSVKIVTEAPINIKDPMNGTMNTMQNILQKYPEGELDAVITFWGLPAIAASKVIESQGRSEIGVYCADVDLGVVQDLQKEDGAIRAVFGQVPQKMGYIATVMALKALNGDNDVPVQMWAPHTLVTKENVDAFGDWNFGGDWKKQ